MIHVWVLVEWEREVGGRRREIDRDSTHDRRIHDRRIHDTHQDWAGSRFRQGRR